MEEGSFCPNSDLANRSFCSGYDDITFLQCIYIYLHSARVIKARQIKHQIRLLNSNNIVNNTILTKFDCQTSFVNYDTYCYMTKHLLLIINYECRRKFLTKKRLYCRQQTTTTISLQIHLSKMLA